MKRGERQSPARTRAGWLSEAGGLICRMGGAGFARGLAVIAWLAFFSALAAAQGGGATPPAPRPPVTMLRHEEDWSSLREPARRTEYLDALKYIPLGREGWYVTLGGEARPYYEWFRNEEWGAATQERDGWLLQRYMLHADMHMGPQVRFFAQLRSGIEIGRAGGPRPPDEDRLGVHQAFLELRHALSERRTLSLRVGRQELNFGSARLVTMREGPNVRLSFDGALVTLREGAWRLDGYAVKPVATNPGVFDDGAITSQSLWGLYAVRPMPQAPRKGNLDLYYFGLDRKRARFNQGIGREQRQTVGARLWNRRGGFDYNYEMIAQFGRFTALNGARGRIRAWTTASETGYSFHRAAFQPRITLKANVTSGDRDPNDPDLGTFNPLFPRGAYFGQLSPVGPLNHRDLHPGIELAFPRRVSVTADWVFYWRQSLRDGVYGVPGNLERSGNRSRERFIGHQPGVEAVWRLDAYTTITLNWAGFRAGRFLRETPPGRNMRYFALWMTYKF